MEKIAVRELAYFVYQEGNLTNKNNFNQSTEDGKYIHQTRQSEYDESCIKEYYIQEIIEFENEKYQIHGYIDGLLNNETKIEEIKTTSEQIYSESFKEKSEHLAQLKIYGYLFLLRTKKEDIELNLLYIERETLRRRTFKYRLNFKELELFFYATLKEYITFLKFINEIEKNRIISAKNIIFPYLKIREGQQQILDFLEENLLNNTFNFILAPTGIGKTVTSLYVAVKKMIEKKDKIFFLTAKTSGKNIAKDTMQALINKGYEGKSLILTAKRKICLINKESCDPDNCPFAKDFFKKLKLATLDILKNEDLIDDKKIINYATKYQLCSFEFSLHLSLYVGVIICDYNYLFDPKVKLIRFFDKSDYNNLILVDEAHNLVSRSQNMYSSSLSIVDLLVLNKYLKDEEYIYKIINKLINYIHKKYDLLLNNNYYLTKDNDLELENQIVNICDYLEDLLDNDKELNYREIILDKYLLLRDYLRISNLYSESHVFLIKLINNNLIIYLNCLDASPFLTEIIKKETKGITYFSATLYPIEYYKKMLVNDNEIKYIELDSPFDNVNNLGLYIAKISTRYKDRNYTLLAIDELIKTTILAKEGKYIIFFPSYQYLKMYLEILNIDNYKIIVQEEGLTEQRQAEILNEFNQEENILGLFVIGGVFSEGIDFIGDKLHGVIIIGVGFPQVNLENEITKEYFNNNNLVGFDFAYTYPGFNKVIQAAGRVIRTETDKGIVLLIDDRYLTNRYLNIFPRHWKHFKIIKNLEDLNAKIINFWDNKKA